MIKEKIYLKDYFDKAVKITLEKNKNRKIEFQRSEKNIKKGAEYLASKNLCYNGKTGTILVKNKKISWLSNPKDLYFYKIDEIDLLIADQFSPYIFNESQRLDNNYGYSEF